MIKNFMDFWAAPDWRLLGFIFVILLVVSGSLYWWRKVFVKTKEKKQKENAITLGDEQINQLFKIRKIDKEKQVALLSSDPTSEHYWGTGDPTWVKTKMENFPEEFKMEGKVIKVTKGSDGKIEIVSVQLHRLPTEKENRPLVEARVAKAAALALELAKAKKAT